MNASTESLSLGWISLDLDTHIETAKNAFESYLSSDQEKTDSGKLEATLDSIQKCLDIFQSTGLTTAGALTQELHSVLQALVHKTLASKADGYQVVIGGINQLLNYLSRLRRSGGENPATVLLVINDLRAVSGNALYLPSDQFRIAPLQDADAENLNDEFVQHLQIANRDALLALTQSVIESLQLIEAQPDEQRQALLSVKKDLICTDSAQLGLENDSRVIELIMACEGIISGALHDGNRLPIAARYTLKNVMQAVADTISEEGSSANWAQLWTEALYCLCINSDTSEASSYLSARYHLDSAIQVDDRAILLRLGTPDVESISIVLDSLSEDIQVLQNSLQVCAEADGDFSSCGDLASMAANLQYTLQIIQFFSLATDLEGVVDQLSNAQQQGRIEISRLEPVVGKLFEIDNALKKFKIGSGRDVSEISAIEQLQAVVLEVHDACARCASLDIDSAKKLISEEQLASEMQSALQSLPDALKQVAGVAQFVNSDYLSEVVAAIQQYYASNIAETLQASDIGAVQDGCSRLASAVTLLDKYLGALKESNHVLIDNLLVQVGEKLGLSGLSLDLSSAGEPGQAAERSARVEDLANDASVSTGGKPVAGEETELSQSAEPESSGLIEQPLTDDIDDEIAEIFLEEAEEVFETISEQFAILRENCGDEKALAEVRRAYHTLKGSGRMAGAEAIGNAAWAIENLLNRVIDNTVALDNPRLSLVAEANQYLPILVDYFKRRVHPYALALESLIARAEIAVSDPAADFELDTSLQLEQNKNTPVVSGTDEELPASATEKEEIADESVLQDIEPALLADVSDALVSEQPEPSGYADEGSDETSFIEEPGSANTAKEPGAVPSIDDIAALQRGAGSDQTDAAPEILHGFEADSSEDAAVTDAKEAITEEATGKVSEVTEGARECEHEPLDISAENSAQDEQLAHSATDTAVPPDDELVAKADDAVAEMERLRAVFMQEVQQQLEVLQNYSVAADADSECLIPDVAVERAFHTLAGSARIAQLDELAELMGPAENLVRVARRKAYFGEAELLLVRRAINSLQTSANSEFANNPGDAQLSAELSAAVTALDADDHSSIDDSVSEISSHCSLVLEAGDFLKAWRVTGEPPEKYTAMLAELKQLAEDSAGESAITQLCQNIGDAYECFRINGLHYTAYTALNHAHFELINMLDNLAAGEAIAGCSADNLQDIVKQELEQAAVAGESSNELDNNHNRADKLDQEIVAIFLEESTDLIEEVESGVTQWVDTPEEDSYLEALLRPLHTLKGGARMAGLDAIGTLCHEFEALLQSVKNGDAATNPSFFTQLQQYLVQLTDQFSAVRSGSIIDSNATASASAQQGDAVHNEKRVAEAIRVPAELLDNLVNLAGETSISRSLVEEHLAEFNHSIDEIESTVERLKEQLRRLEIETEAQIAFRREKVEIEGLEEFDPLEMDRYSQLQQLSKSLVESASDLKDLKTTLRDKTRDVETLLLQQARINTELQEGLMQTRTVPLSRTIVPRLRKTVRQVSGELDKPVTFHVGSSDGELDKSVIERMVAPLEHVLRNAIDHGIESAEERQQRGKPAAGAIKMTINREGSDVVLRISDDGKGVDVKAVREKAIENGLIRPDQNLSDDDLVQLIFAPGFSTAQAVTQISGRGVGMDVVKSEIQELGGTVELHSESGKGTLFVIRLPFTMSMNRALMVSAGGESIAVPLDTIEGIVRVSPYELEEYYGENAVDFLYAGHKYDFRYLGAMLNGSEPQYSGEMVGALPVLLVRAGEQLIAYQVDRLLGSREIVVKSLGPQFTELPGIIGATVLGDGSVVMIADLGALSRRRTQDQLVEGDLSSGSLRVERDRPLAMVVDDSVTVRKVTTRLLERQGMDVITAKDGQDAMDKLEEIKPDFMLLDIEMPRLDGFEVVSRVRHDPRLNDLPIIMITSRTGEKHRERALSLGANEFLGKPYQEQVLFSKIADIAPGIVTQYAVGE